MSAEAILGEQHVYKPVETAQEKHLYACFVHAQTEYIKSYQWQKVPGLKRFGADADALQVKYQDALEAYLAAYATHHSEWRTKARRANLASKTGYLERFWVAQHVFGRAAGIVSRTVMAAGRKTENLVATHSKTAQEHPIASKWLIRFLMGGVLTAAVIAAVAFALHATPMVAAAMLAKRIIVGGSLYLLTKILSPLALSQFSFFQNHPRALVFARELLGWASFGLGFANANHLSAGMMHNLPMHSPDESVNTTLRNIGVQQIDQIRGSTRFMPIDQSLGSPLAHAVNDVSLAYDVRSSSPVLAEMWTNLNGVESHRVLLLNTLENRTLVSDGAAIMEHLRVLEASRLHGGNQGYGVFQNVSQELQQCRAQAQNWNVSFAMALQDAAEEQHKNSFQIGVEYFNTHPLQPLPLLNDFFLSHNPAHLLVEVPISNPNAAITVEALLQSETIIQARLNTLDHVIDYYSHIINPRFNPGDRVFGSLVEARTYFQNLLAQTHSMDSLFARLPQGHVVSNHSGSLSGVDLTDAQILDSLNHMRNHFGPYQKVWNDVRAANTRAEDVQSGHTILFGKDVQANEVFPFKEGVPWAGLTPFMVDSLYEAHIALHNVGIDDMYISEGWKLTYFGHVSQCHADGTCVDIGGSFTGERIYKIFTALKPLAKRLLLESKTQSGTSELIFQLKNYLIHDPHGPHYTPDEAAAWMKANADIEWKQNATGDNLHFEPLDGKPIDPVVFD